MTDFLSLGEIMLRLKSPAHERFIRWGDRVGIYFLETGSNQRPSKVADDRAG